MHSMSLGYSFEPRLNSHALATAVLVVTIGFSINSNKIMDAALKKTSLKRENKIDWSRSLGCGHLKGLTWFKQSRLLVPDTQEDQRRLCLHGDTTGISIQSSCFRIFPCKWHLLSFLANDTQLHALTFANKKKLSLIIIVGLNFSVGEQR